MRVRKNAKQLTSTERNLFIQAIQGLKARNSVLHPGSQSRYDDFVEVHLMAMMSIPNWGHGDSAFLPWHREMLFQFEQELRSVPGCASVTIPYWEWTREQSAANAGFPFTNDFIGQNGQAAAPNRVLYDAAAGGLFNPETWDAVVKDDPGDSADLRRRFGSRADAPNLPQNDALVTGVNSTFRQAIGSGDYLTLRSRSEDIHNLVHRWVNGSMIEMASPNDPVFYFHHAAIDRMWSIWRETHPALTSYVHNGGVQGHIPGQPMIFHHPGETAPWPGSMNPDGFADLHTQHGESVWYDTDRPIVSLDSGPTLALGDVPEGLTTYRAARFRVSAFRQVRFRITGAPAGNFGLTPMGANFTADPTYSPDPFDAFVWFQFHAVGAASQSATATIEAYFVDEEGYYAATEGGEVLLGTYTITLTAGVVPRASHSVVLALDRSGSMAAAAGGTSTRSSLLRTAAGVFHTLLLPDDQIGIVSFDDVTETPLALGLQSAGLGGSVSGPALDPRGMTAIGLGIQAGSAMLAGAAHPNRSLLVLTDGNQNVHPYVEELPAGTIHSRVYAIGFGLPGQVSDAVLNQITQNTDGDLVITGTLSTDAERFQLTKYFAQVLAGVTNANVILDPQGELTWGAEHQIPFTVTAADVSFVAIALSPLPPFVSFELIAPNGTVMRRTATGPNASYHEANDVAFYRVGLPADPADPKGSHAGIWTAVLRLEKLEEIRKHLQDDRLPPEAVVALMERKSLPYSFLAHATSNLDFRATARQDGMKPGAMIALSATLTEYGIPLESEARVWAEMVWPDGSTAPLKFTRTAPGRYEADLRAKAAGLYRFRVRAEGHTTAGDPFAREKGLTAGVFVGEPSDQNVGEEPHGRMPPRPDRADCPRAAVWELARRVLADSPKELFSDAVPPVPVPKPVPLDPKVKEEMRRKAASLPRGAHFPPPGGLQDGGHGDGGHGDGGTGHRES
ncbi:conserved hypothetical protein [uncultured Defluviicoccus sp.]|uniref:VWFA domain-containing protein n=1 Tax=metagenome TaxID=256318 RepID=A0A380TBC3_9ZZZZ|nr:conserved hypothetical protein [uncultured Defluviicoccus sp.]